MDSKENFSLAGGLYIVATPIGNLQDITLRALDVLRRAHIIACEDTRVSAKLLLAHGITTATTSYNDHNAPRKRPQLLSRLRNGEAVALISDAGTPLISDPGYRLVSEAQEQGIDIIPIPGASSVMAALMVAGLPTDCFYFAGFLPTKSQAKSRAIHILRDISASLVILESPKRIAATLRLLAEILGNRDASLCRELTKRYEEVRRGRLEELAAHYADVSPPKGEIVLVIAANTSSQQQWSDEEINNLLRSHLENLSLKDAVTKAATISGIAKKELYDLALKLRNE